MASVAQLERLEPSPGPWIQPKVPGTKDEYIDITRLSISWGIPPAFLSPVTQKQLNEFNNNIKN